jgi:hypothetical protein
MGQYIEQGAYDTFDEFFEPQPNHLRTNSGFAESRFGGIMYETDGELEYIQSILSTHKDRIWTVIINDKYPIKDGYYVGSYVSGYIITKRPMHKGHTYEFSLPKKYRKK